MKNHRIDMELKMLYEDFMDIMMSKVLIHKDAQVVASTMIALALRLYKSTLSEGEFKDMLKVVVKNAKTIEPFVVRRLH
jgi:hypothetical protein